MSWPTHGPAREREDYRDPAFEHRVTELAQRGVLVSGTSRSGKTTLLHRLADHKALGPEATNIIDLSIGRDAVFERIQGKGGLLLDEGQCLLSWQDADILKLRVLLQGRAFVLATWPSILRSDRSRELFQFIEAHPLETLSSLTIDETARMIRRDKSPAPHPCPDELVGALYRATGGQPNLVARLCAFQSDQGAVAPRAPSEQDLADFIDSVADNNPFTAIYDSLPPRAQQLLTGRRDAPGTRLDPLRAYGLASGAPAQFTASLFSLAWSADPGSLQAPAPLPQPRSPVRRAPRPAVTWLHLSDLHFGAGSQQHRFNQAAVIEAIRRDVANELPWKSPDFVFITGDIAFSGKKAEYKLATKWLNTLLQAAGASPKSLRMVPGNHDSDRRLAAEAPTASLHDTIRAAPEQLDALLEDKRSHDLLAAKLKAYVNFVKELAPEHPGLSTGSVLDWSDEHEAADNRHGRIQLVGLSTVWVSDAGDGERKLVLGERQLQPLNKAEADDLLMVLTHHPPSWLHHSAEALLLNRMAERAPHLHLCGHVHQAKARGLKEFGVQRPSLRFVAGAAHGDESDAHGYAWGALRWNAGRWELGWAPRVFVPGRPMCADRNRYELADDNFAWESIALDWKPPSS